MVLRRAILPLALFASLAVAGTASASDTKPGDSVAHVAGGDVAPLTPSIVGIPIMRTERSLTKAGDRIDDGNGAGAVGPLTASRRYLLRSYNGAKYLIAHPPPAPAGDGSANPQKFRKLARSFIRASRHGRQGAWIKAHASGGAVGPAFADGVTAVFDVFPSQYNAATAAVDMAPDTKGDLLAKVKTTLNTAIVLRNRLVKVVHAAAPPAPAEDGSAHAHASDGPPTFDAVMPGLTVLLDDELQQMQAAAADNSV